MPFAGLGLHILLAVFCAVHVVRTGQQLYWLFILFAFPLLGSLVYFFMIYLPNSRLERGAMKAVSAAAKAMDPTRGIREARAEYEATPTAQNQMRLAAALLESGQADEAAGMYEAGLKGMFASDPDIRFGAARAFTEAQKYQQGLAHLEALRAAKPDFRADAVTILFARCYAGTSRQGEARSEFEAAVSRFGTFEAYAEYAIWALAIGDASTAARLQTDIDKLTKRWNSLSRELNEPVLRRLQAAQQLARKGA